MILSIPVNEIDEDFLHTLVGTLEDSQIEFKKVLPSRNPSDIIEKFLKPVSAMANSGGGDVIYGIREGRNQAGHTVADAITGIAHEDPDDVKQRFENLIRTSIEPRIIGHTIHPVRLNTGNCVYLVRIPKSWVAPHVVKYGGHWRLYYRNSAGTHPMDLTELRHAFTFANATSQLLHSYRLERLAKIHGDESLGRGGTIVLHLQPVDSLDPETLVDFLRAREDLSRLFLIYHCAPYLDGRFANDYRLSVNFDGLLSIIERSPTTGYVQLYRNGVIESVDTTVLREVDDERPCIPGRNFEQKLSRPPFAISVSFLISASEHPYWSTCPY
jgi:hypothetical protein